MFIRKSRDQCARLSHPVPAGAFLTARGLPAQKALLVHGGSASATRSTVLAQYPLACRQGTGLWPFMQSTKCALKRTVELVQDKVGSDAESNETRRLAPPGLDAGGLTSQVCPVLPVGYRVRYAERRWKQDRRMETPAAPGQLPAAWRQLPGQSIVGVRRRGLMNTRKTCLLGAVALLALLVSQTAGASYNYGEALQKSIYFTSTRSSAAAICRPTTR